MRRKKERKLCQEVKAAKAVEKQVETEAHSAHLIQDVALKAFNHPLSSYKKKNELCAISLGLEIFDQGTITELMDPTTQQNRQANHHPHLKI